MSKDEQSFHKVMAIMFPIRNALMYDARNLSKNHWLQLTDELRKRNIKMKSFLEGATPKDNNYGINKIFDLVKNKKR